MKRYLFPLMVTLALFSAQGVLAQDNQQIILNDATPGIDVVVSTPPGTTGAVALQLSGASVNVTDNAGNTLFQVSDPRVHSLELHFAPGSSPHTITVERLPGIAQAFVSTASQLDLTQPIGAQLIDGGTVNLGQELDTSLSAASPGATLSLSIPTTTPVGKVIAAFPGTSAAAQLIDSSGVSVANLQPSQIDGLSLTLDSGNYGLTLLNQNNDHPTLAAVSVVPDTTDQLPAAVATSISPAIASSTQDCTIQIMTSSVNLRSGPGTGYSVLDYGFRNDALPVGGTNSDGTWLLVGGSQGSAWMDKTLGNLNGDCGSLETYDIPYREAVAPQIIIQQPANSGNNSPVFSSGGEHENHEGSEHEGDD